MAQNFRNYLTRNTGASAVDALGGAANSYDTLISVRMANVTTSTISVDVYLRRSSANYYLIKNAPIVSGGSGNEVCAITAATGCSPACP